MIRLAKLCFIVAVLMAVTSCSSLRLDGVDFGWPVESVVTVSGTNMIEDIRYSVKAEVAPLAQEEFQDSTALRGARLRLLRSSEGYYFLTGVKFKHVYVFSPGPSSLTLYRAIPVSDGGLRNPALNQRPPYVELLDGDALRTLLTSDDIVEAKK
jgi:hypothetical protein